MTRDPIPQLNHQEIVLRRQIETLIRERDEAVSALNRPSECGEEACVWHVTQHFKIKKAEAERDAAIARAEKAEAMLSTHEVEHEALHQCFLKVEADRDALLSMLKEAGDFIKDSNEDEDEEVNALLARITAATGDTDE